MIGVAIFLIVNGLLDLRISFRVNNANGLTNLLAGLVGTTLGILILTGTIA